MAPAPSAPSASLTNGGMTKVGMSRSPVANVSQTFVSQTFWRRTASQSVARPDRPRLECRDDLLGKIRAPQQRLQNSRLHPAEPAAAGGHERGDDLIAEPRTQDRTQVADAVGKAKLHGLVSCPIFSGKQGFF